MDYYDKTRDLWGELLKYAVYNCVQELGQSVDICAVEVFQGNADHVYIILSSQDGGCNLEEQGAGFAGRIRGTILEVLEVETALGIGNRYSGLERMGDSIQEAFTALKYRHLSEREMCIRDRDEGIRFMQVPEGEKSCVDACSHVYLMYDRLLAWQQELYGICLLYTSRCV